MATSANEHKSVAQVLTELWDLTRTYARQETIDPLKGLGRYLAYGLGGAVVGGMGVVLLLLALLRALQTETGSTFTGNWSWAPYLIVIVAAIGVAAYALSRITRKQGL